MKIHEIKLKQVYFEDVLKDIRTFVLLDSRIGYQIGDILVITEWCFSSLQSNGKRFTRFADCW